MYYKSKKKARLYAKKKVAMVVKNLTLKNFRNYKSERFEYSSGINIIVGSNAQGKTNSAEAVFLLATGFSPKAKKDKQVILYGEEKAEICAEAEFKFGKVSVGIDFFKEGKKRIVINGAEVKRVGDLLGNIHAVFFNPGELKLVQESPEDRRRFLDISLSQINKRYFHSLSKYKKILVQRNNLLKESDRELILDTLPVWDEQLAFYAADIIIERSKFIEVLEPLAKEAHHFITDGKENLTVKGSTKFFGTNQEIINEFYKGLSESREKDMILGYTTIGPHRDDLKITLNGEDVRSFSSQGQQRTVALALKLAELEIFKKHFGEYPVLILDDAMSELDKSRQKRLLQKIQGVQTIITCTHIDKDVFDGVDYKKFVIEGGKIV